MLYDAAWLLCCLQTVDCSIKCSSKYINCSNLSTTATFPSVFFTQFIAAFSTHSPITPLPHSPPVETPSRVERQSVFVNLPWNCFAISRVIWSQATIIFVVFWCSNPNRGNKYIYICISYIKCNFMSNGMLIFNSHT